jgi:hypothetical protein
MGIWMIAYLVRAALAVVLGGPLLIHHWKYSDGGIKAKNLFSGFLRFLSILCILLTGGVIAGHLSFPLSLETMEGTILQHLRRAAQGEPVYTEPAFDFVALAYNPLYYYLTVPFTWIFGVHLFSLRLVSALAMAGIAVVLYLAVKETTRSRSWGIFAAGLFAASYKAMDSYLDTAHSDSCYILSALAGTYILHKGKSKQSEALGILVLISSFWFKQTGFFFTLGGLLYLTWRGGWIRSLPYWGLSFLFGVLAYVYAGPWLFGPEFHFFTWEVPSAWTEFTLEAHLRYAKYLFKFFPILLLAIGINVARLALRYLEGLSLWFIQLVVAFQTGLLGALDPGSSDNVFACAGVWIILVGTQSIHDLARRRSEIRKPGWHYFAVLASFLAVVYNPLSVSTSPKADESFAELIRYLEGLEGEVYSTSIGSLDKSEAVTDTAHWVALEDLVRGPGLDTTDHPQVKRLLRPLLENEKPVYLIEYLPLDSFPMFTQLNENFVLAEDLRDRFRPLECLPGRFFQGWPRYLYRSLPAPATSEAEVSGNQ